MLIIGGLWVRDRVNDGYIQSISQVRHTVRCLRFDDDKIEIDLFINLFDATL